MDLKTITYTEIWNKAPSAEPERQEYFMDLCRRAVEAWKQQEQKTAVTFHIETFGCQMNAHDSEKLEGILLAAGFEHTDTEEADLVLYNTCTVRENANQRVYGRLGYLNSLKKKNPRMLIGLCGCMMQEDQVVEKIKKTYRFVDVIFGTHNIYKLAELLYARFETGRMVIDIWKDTDKIVEDLPSERKYPFKSGVNIMFGCNNFCSYCIVPYVRGRERSRKPEDIVKEIEGLVADGVVEVMLLGQNVNSYGKNLEEPVSFAELLRRVEQIEGLERIRFMTSHPKDLSDELIEVMRDSKKICRHLHLPLQSGSSRILGQMNRRYTKEKYLELAEKIKREIPDISLTTDIIVGFPGETEEEFEATRKFLEEIGLYEMHVFKYSKRAGTRAAVMEDQVNDQEKARRSAVLIAMNEEHKNAFENRQIGTRRTVLIEEKLRNSSGNFYVGHTKEYVKVAVESEEPLENQIVEVELTGITGEGYVAGNV